MDRYEVRGWTLVVEDIDQDLRLNYCTLNSPDGRCMTGYCEPAPLLAFLGIGDEQKALPQAHDGHATQEEILACQICTPRRAPEPVPEVATTSDVHLYCTKNALCCLGDGHDGTCDDMPF